jgi:hypothetical protein
MLVIKMTKGLISRIRMRLQRENFKSINPAKGRSDTLNIDGALVDVKLAKPMKSGKWMVNIHRHGELDESGVDAYLILLSGVPGNDSMLLYLVLPAPVNRPVFAFSTSSLIRIYNGAVDDWETLRRIAKRASKNAPAVA